MEVGLVLLVLLQQSPKVVLEGEAEHGLVVFLLLLILQPLYLLLVVLVEQQEPQVLLVL